MRSHLCLAGVLLVVAALAAPQLSAQQGTVTGRVTDQSSGQPLGAVQMVIGGTGIGGLTQQNGRYSLTNVPVGTHTVTAQRIGYASVSHEVTVTADGTVEQDFVMSQQALRLDDVIVTGTPGGTQRRAIGNSVTTLQASEVTESVAISSVQDLLSGRSPGVQFNRVSGNVGTGSPIEIRGTGSFNLSSQPLIYVDGVRVNNATRAGPEIGQEAQVSVLDDFNPADIESIEIIKGPAAATLYGTEASAGVIQIITKRGAQGAPQFDISVRQGVNFLRDPAGKIGTFWGCREQFAPPCREDSGLVPYSPYHEANLLLHDGTLEASEFTTESWPVQNIFQYGLSQSYNIGVRGGTDLIRYFVSGNFDEEEGMEWWNRNRAARLRANIGVNLSERVTLDVSTGYVDGFTRFGQPARSDGGLYEDMIWGNGYCQPRINNDPQPGGACPRLMGFQEHLPHDVARVEATRQYNRFTGSGTLNFNPTSWLSTRGTFGIDHGWDENTTIYPLEIVEPVYFRMPIGETTVARPKNTNMTVDISATATRNLLQDRLSTATSVGVQYNERAQTNFGVRGVGFASPVSRTINQTPSALSTVLYDYVENKSAGAYIQEQLGWEDRLFITGAVRFDDNSAFGGELDPEMYPKLSGTWVISEESFFDFPMVDQLRLRGAWGTAGRQPDAFARVSRYTVVDGPLGTSAFAAVGPGNVEVGPEKSTELELGFDYALFDRISGEFSWYTQKNEDALLNVALEPSRGLAGALQRNIGRIDNWGWEATMNASIYESSDLSLQVDLSGTGVNNEIKSLGDFPGVSGQVGNIKIGFPYPNYANPRPVVSAEFDPNGPIANRYGDRISAMCDAGRRTGEGSQYGLLPGGEIIPCSEKDTEAVLMGPSFFTHRFSVSPRLTLFENSLQVHVLVDGAYGRALHDNKNATMNTYQGGRVTRVEDDPLWVAQHRYGDTQGRTLFEADFWKLREVGVRYNLPESIVGVFGGDRASLALSAREIAELWRKQPTNWDMVMVDGEMADPEVGRVNSSNNRVAPPMTHMSVTLRVTF